MSPEAFDLEIFTTCCPIKNTKLMGLFVSEDTLVRRAGTAVSSAAVALTSLVPRMVWKFQGWLTGSNGGPLRGPIARVNSAQMAQLRQAAKAAGVAVDDAPDDEFFRGRNPA